MTEIIRIDQNDRRSRASVFGDLVFLAGQVAGDTSADIGPQTQHALDRVDEMLARAGTDKSRALSVQIWLRDIADLEGMNAVYDRWVVPDHRPSRCCAQIAAFGDPNCRVEIIVVAAGAA